MVLSNGQLAKGPDDFLNHVDAVLTVRPVRIVEQPIDREKVIADLVKLVQEFKEAAEDFREAARDEMDPEEFKKRQIKTMNIAEIKVPLAAIVCDFARIIGISDEEIMSLFV
jgi:hypothetical protein